MKFPNFSFWNSPEDFFFKFNKDSPKNLLKASFLSSIHKYVNSSDNLLAILVEFFPIEVQLQWELNFNLFQLTKFG